VSAMYFVQLTLANRKPFAPQHLPSLFVALDLMSYAGYRFSLSWGSQPTAVAERFDNRAASATAAGSV
jgi:hypothetical protein